MKNNTCLHIAAIILIVFFCVSCKKNALTKRTPYIFPSPENLQINGTVDSIRYDVDIIKLSEDSTVYSDTLHILSHMCIFDQRNRLTTWKVIDCNTDDNGYSMSFSYNLNNYIESVRNFYVRNGHEVSLSSIFEYDSIGRTTSVLRIDSVDHQVARSYYVNGIYTDKDMSYTYLYMENSDTASYNYVSYELGNDNFIYISELKGDKIYVLNDKNQLASVMIPGPSFDCMIRYNDRGNPVKSIDCIFQQELVPLLFVPYAHLTPLIHTLKDVYLEKQECNYGYEYLYDQNDSWIRCETKALNKKRNIKIINRSIYYRL